MAMDPAPVSGDPTSAIRQGASPPSKDADAPVSSGRRFAPLASLRAHWLLSSVTAALIAGITVPLVSKPAPLRYATRSVIQIAPRFAGNLASGSDKELELQSNQQYREFVQQQVRSVNRFDVVKEAVAALGAQGIAWRRTGEAETQAVERLQAALRVKPIPDTYLIEISLEGEDPSTIAAVVNASVEAFLSMAKREELYDSDDRIHQLKRERGQLDDQLTRLMARRTALAGELDVATFSETTRNPFDELLMAARTQLATARAHRFEAAARAAAIDGQERAEGTAALNAAADELVAQDAGLMSLKSNLNQRRAALLAKESGLAPDHPGRLVIDRELAGIDAEVDRVAGQLRTTVAAMLKAKAQAELFATEHAERELATQVETLASQSRSFASTYQEAMIVGGDMERLRRRRDAVDDRIDFLHLETRAPGFFRLIAPARALERPISGGSNRKLGELALLVALILGLAIAPAVDALDRRVHTADELRAVVGFPILAAVEGRAGKDDRASREHSVRRLTTSLLRERRLQGTRVLAFTSVRADRSSTDLVADVAFDLAARDMRVLIIGTYGAFTDPRFSSTGATGANVQEVLNGTALPAPSRLPVLIAGPASRQPLAHLEALEQVLADTTAYDFVLIDTAPSFVSADTAWIVGVAELTIVVAEASAATRADVARAMTNLESLHPAAVGVVLNHVTRGDALFTPPADAPETPSSITTKVEANSSRWKRSA